jgi:hypothetical protein
MRVQAIAWKVILVCFFALSAHAANSEEKDMRKLFDKYEKVMSQQETKLIEEVFTKKFLEAHGGKEAYAEKVKTLPYIKPKKGVAKFFHKLKRSKVGKFFTVKDNQDGEVSKSFIVKEEDGKLKIDGTVSDG